MSFLLPPYIQVNINGIPTLSSNSVTVSSDRVSFDFNNHRNVGSAFRGLLIVRLAQPIPADAGAELPIYFTSDGSNPTPVTTFNGEPVEVDFIPGTGVYVLWYENQTNTLQLLTGSLPN